MPFQPVRFYQTGTFTVGNRLLPEGQRSVQADMRRTNSLNSGHRACQGCGEALGARYALDAAMQATANQLIAANATGCLEVFSTPYPETSWQIPWIHSLFGNAAAVATGIAAAMRVKGQDHVRVVAQGGDGGTTDIGLGCLSGMFERNDDVLYICYDNEGYGNTGQQSSSATPHAAITSTSGGSRGYPGYKKDLFSIWAAHRPAYVATVIGSEPLDLARKIEKARELKGSRMIIALAPCPTGWDYDPKDSVEVGRLAVKTGIWPLKEYIDGQLVHTRIPRERAPVEEYLRLQGRFAHLFSPRTNTDLIAEIQARVDRYWGEVV